MLSKHLPRAGFTLIEMSTVLVIIGLIVGGILTGQDLIRLAQRKSQIKQLQDYQTAFNTFQTKYGCIPGDCINATSFFGTTDPSGNTVNNGNGNGLIDTGNGSSTNNGGPTWNTNIEIWGAFQQMGLAGLINFTPGPGLYAGGSEAIGKTFPTINMSPNTGLFIGANYNFNNAGGKPLMTSYQKGSNILWLTLCNQSEITADDFMNTWDDNCGVFIALDLQAIDQKIDDGMPLSGNLLGFGGGSTTNNNCLVTPGSASTAYLITNATAQCQAAFVIN